MSVRSADPAFIELKRKLTVLTDQIRSLLSQMRDEVLAESITVHRGARDQTLGGFEHFVDELYDTKDLPVLGMGFLPSPHNPSSTRPRWWYNKAVLSSKRARMMPLAAAAQPEALDYYDMVATEWWCSAAESDHPVAAGPFVDISGTNAYVVTFAQSVRLDGDLIGVVAADLTVATLQALCQNDLLDLPRPTSVVNDEGMVLATNAGALLGSVVDVAAVPSGRKRKIPGTSWLLVTTR